MAELCNLLDEARIVYIHTYIRSNMFRKNNNCAFVLLLDVFYEMTFVYISTYSELLV